MSKKLVYSIKITLKGSNPPIWRQLLVSSDTTLVKLHDIIQIAMGWEDEHLHAFQINGKSYTRSDMMYGESDMNDESKMQLSQVAQIQSTFTYEYDFGDGWLHEISIEGIVSTDEVKMPLPYCVKGERSCPPEDCGGIWGYADMLEKLAGPRNKERKELMEWLGGEFDSEEFDIHGVNERLGV